MLRSSLILGSSAAVMVPALLALLGPGDAFSGSQEPGPAAAQFDGQGRLVFPRNYREWVFLSAGHGMSYTDAASGTDAPFDNVFVDPGALRAFKRTGRWPDGAVLILEIRGGSSQGSLIKGGAFQTGEPVVIEAHVKDSRRFAGGWGFFEFDGRKPANVIDRSAPCYACHQEHGAVETTFVQFYPTLEPVARAKGSYLSRPAERRHDR